MNFLAKTKHNVSRKMHELHLGLEGDTPFPINLGMKIEVIGTYLDERVKHSYTETQTHRIVLEKISESPLDSKDTKPVHPKGNQPRIFIGRTDAGAEAPVLWPPDAKS